MSKKSKYVLVIILCVVIISGTYILGFSAKNDNSSKKTTNFLSAQVKKGNIKVTASGSANVQASIKKEIKSLDNGIVDSIFVNEGEFVDEGELILTFEDSSSNTEIERIKLDLVQAEDKLEDLESSTESLKIYASQSGFLSDISAKVGNELSNGYLLATITNKSKIEVSGFFNKKNLENINVGDKANIILPEYLTEVSGIVNKVNKAPIPKEGGGILYEVVVSLENPGGFSSDTRGTVVVNTSEGSFTSVEEAYFETPDPEEIKLKTGGELSKLYASSGDYVEAGALIAEVENSSIQKDIEYQKIEIENKKIELTEKIKDLDDTAVYAPISGIVTQMNVTKGERVANNATLMVISDLNNLEVIIPVDELDINKIDLNKEAKVTAQAVPDVSYDAKVSKVALEGVVNNGVATFDVTLSLKEISGLKPGMTVNGEIIIDSKENAMLLPVEAIQYRQGKKFVLVKNSEGNDEPKATSVEIGLVSEDYVEIVDGLKEGDTVLYQSTATNSQSQQRQGMGMMEIRTRPSGGFPSNNRTGGSRPSGGGN
ncbi:efflux RND transporter periplasmic adaptor subunit [Brassicibacter mesophilus]|uniref:efflux RND transporter periplasmic adaptor subunit n=1 Tax=Brassicibacter mesophilus TaxID=745119 RepID=UPI003D1A858A